MIVGICWMMGILYDSWHVQMIKCFRNSKFEGKVDICIIFQCVFVYGKILSHLYLFAEEIIKPLFLVYHRKNTVTYIYWNCMALFSSTSGLQITFNDLLNSF
jgi:hypothetical protein